MIRITASLVHKSGAEILRHDSSPIERTELRGAIEEAIAFLCDEDGYTVEEGSYRVVLRIQPVSGVATTALPRLLEMPTQAQHRRTDAGTAQNAPALQR